MGSDFCDWPDLESTEKRVLMDDLEYYRTKTGLPFESSRPDLERAYFQQMSGLPDGLRVDDYKHAFFSAETGEQSAAAAELAYYASKVKDPVGKSISDLRREFFNLL